ncbi:hypothetical protein [Streptomyces sp. AVP053U2]|uniref:hypothetical protein n=1 Tax=Streptomyces sp. AVP053U2 TaxID=1737066 RepID=UPI00073AF4C2|nr:hypothetical protein [Streptomyces sp. AVP053U2]ODA75557.1 hypothetical protein APS67_000120 [Streptomyces sp. AVP053U2]
MTSHVDQQIQARIAAVAAKKQQQREEREAFARQRAAGLVSRKRAKLRRVFCGTCARLQRPAENSTLRWTMCAEHQDGAPRLHERQVASAREMQNHGKRAAFLAEAGVTT